MKGSPGFIGERLKQGREARGLSVIALAELLGITRQAISSFETGGSTPQPDTLEEIANKLNLPVAFFMTPIKDQKPHAVFFRSMCAATKYDRGRGYNRINWLAEFIVPYLQQFVVFPKINAPNVILPKDPLHLTEDEIEDIATKVRRDWGLGDGPISNVVLLFENNGFIITRMELESSTLDAFSTHVWHNDNPYYMVLGDDKRSAVRSRFDAAHEMGHSILHRTIAEDQLKNPVIFKLVEQQANRFASSFLVPRNKFAGDFTLPTLNSFQTLKYKWLVSIAMLIRRSFDLGFISEEHYQRLWINYNRRGWRKEEPLDDRLPIEQPVLLPRACKLIIESKIKTPEQMLSEIPLMPKDVEELLYVPRGYLVPSMPQLELKNKLGNEDYKAALEEADRIIKNL